MTTSHLGFQLLKKQDTNVGFSDRTLIIFNDDDDTSPYDTLQGWIEKGMGFDFFNVSNLYTAGKNVDETKIRLALADRLSDVDQVVVIASDETKDLDGFFRWQIDICNELEIPIIVANLNQNRVMDPERCPRSLQGTCTLHIPFNPVMFLYALEDFFVHHSIYRSKKFIDLFYPPSVYVELELS